MKRLLALSVAANVLLLAGYVPDARRSFIAAFADHAPVTLYDLKRDIQASHRADVVLLGDSIIDLMEPEYLPIPFANRGISGDTTSGVLARLPDILAGNPKTIILLVGINDLQKGASASDVIAGIKRIRAAVDAINAAFGLSAASLASDETLDGLHLNANGLASLAGEVSRNLHD